MKHARLHALICLLLIVCMVLPLAAACGRKKGDDETPADTPAETNASVVNAPEITYLSGRQAIATATDVDDGFVPVLRFAVTSDIHTRSADSYSSDIPTSDELQAAADRTAALFRLPYQYAEKSAYPNVDAVMVVGDYTDFGRRQQYEAFLGVVNAEKRDGTELLVCLGNHEFWNTGESAGTATDTTRTYARFEEYFGHEPDSHVVIGGYHFIGVSPDCNGGRNYSDDKATWLTAQMRIAAADDPTGQKPIFVYQHIAPARTVYGSKKTDTATEAYAAITLGNVLKNYPQAVVFAGHSHRPVTDPGCIMQGDYTVFNTGTLAYGCYEIYTAKGGATRGMLPLGNEGDWYDDMNDNWYEHGERESSAFTLIEVDAQNRVRVQYIDADSGYLLEEPIILDNIGKKDEFTLTVGRAATSELPYFKATDAVTVAWIGPTAVRLCFPQATSRDKVRDYKVELYQNGELIETSYRFSNVYFPPIPTALIAPFSGLKPATTYEVKIYGYNAWGKLTAEPLCGSFTTPALDAEVAAPDVFSIAFRADGTAYDAVSGKDLVKTGRVSTSRDRTLDRTVGVFTGSGDYQWRDLSAYRDILQSGFTFELYARIDEFPTGDGFINPASGQNDGGFGFELHSDQNALIYLFSKKAKNYVIAYAPVKAGEYVHLVATFNGKTLCLYVNGTLAATETVSSEMFLPVKPSATYLSIGADASTDYTAHAHFTGRIAAVNLYATPLDATQVAALYDHR